MAKRLTKAEIQGIVWLIIIGVPIWLIISLVKSVGWIPLVVFAGVCIGAYFLLQQVKKKNRLEYLRNRYQDEELVQRIYKGYFWEGQTEQQLLDSIGKPAAIDEKLLKTKKKEIWKYNHKGSNRYGLRITLENNIVTGWDQKA